MKTAEFTEAAIGEETFGGAGKFDEAEGSPKIFAEAGRDGLFAEERELFEGFVVIQCSCQGVYYLVCPYVVIEEDLAAMFNHLFTG